MSGVRLGPAEEEALYVVLKAREERLAQPLQGLLRRLEQTLFQRLTIEQLEGLSNLYPESR
jgi:hypothetical protein